MNPRIARITARLLFSACLLTTVVGASSAFAYEGTVPNDCTVGGVQLQGMTEAEARAAIASESVLPTYTPLVAVARGRVYTYAPTLSLNIEKMLASAYSTATPAGYDIPVAWGVVSPAFSTWVKSVALANDRIALNAMYRMSAGRLTYRKSRNGYRLDQTRARIALSSALSSACAGSVVETLTLPATTILPKVPTAKLGKAIVVDISSRNLRVYRYTRRLKTYRVAVGTASHPTPRGNFRIIKKAKNPTWYNPGSAWASGMPSYIGPGVNNPLGTRALYLNAPGIRIHGTAKRSSIGTAASHGCLRMLRENIEALFPTIPVGTPVFIVK